MAEQDFLVSASRDIPGCLGARLTGAGFGGCTINLVESASVQAFILELSRRYYIQTGRSAPVYLCQASQGAAAGQIC